MKPLNKAFVTFLVITFITGLYLYTNYPVEKFDDSTESKSTDKDSSCPDLLINKGNILLLYNTKKPELTGVNPIPFYNLDEYINYLEIQRNKGIRCPVLYAQRENDTQGNDIYRVRPSPFNQEGGLPPSYLMNKSQINHLDLQEGPPPSVLYDYPANLNKNKPVPVLDASRDSSIYNKGNYAGFDPYGLHQGTYSELDKIHDSTAAQSLSDNPLDSNWGGILYTQKMIDSGKYAENNITKPQYVTPRTGFIPGLSSVMPLPKDNGYYTDQKEK
jgi:hypothetical protein